MRASRPPKWMNRLRGAAAGWLVVLGGACLSPTLPLPPPEEPYAISASPAGDVWEVRGSCLEGAQVVLLNEATGRGVVYVDREAAGSYVVSVEGAACDVVLVSQTVGDEGSGETRFVLRPRQNGVDSDPSLCSP